MESVNYDTEIAEMETETQLESIPDSTELKTDEINVSETILGTESVLYVTDESVNNQSTDILSCMTVIIIALGVLSGIGLGRIFWGCIK